MMSLFHPDFQNIALLVLVPGVRIELHFPLKNPKIYSVNNEDREAVV